MMRFDPDHADFAGTGEARMIPIVVDWLYGRRWLRQDSKIVREFPLHGRRVDLVTSTRSGSTAAYEFKLGSFGRVLEQAVYNRGHFDRSWIVIDARPRPINVAEARRFGVGIIVLSGSSPEIIVKPELVAASSRVTARRIQHRLSEFELLPA